MQQAACVCNVAATISDYKLRISDRPSSETENLYSLTYPVLLKFNSYFFCVLLSGLDSVLTVTVEAMTVLYPIGPFCQEENGLHMECLQYQLFSQEYIGATRSSRVSRQQNSNLVKHLNVIFCSSL